MRQAVIPTSGQRRHREIGDAASSPSRRDRARRRRRRSSPADSRGCRPPSSSPGVRAGRRRCASRRSSRPASPRRKRWRRRRPTLHASVRAGAPKARPMRPAATPSCATSIQARRRPSQPREAGNVEAIDEGRPEELEREGERAIAHQPDVGLRDPRLAQPRRLRREDQQERQAGGIAERQHQREAGIGDGLAEEGEGFHRRGIMPQPR